MRLTIFLLYILPLNSIAQEVVTGRTLKVLLDVNKSLVQRELNYEWENDPFKKSPGYVSGIQDETGFELKAIVFSKSERSLAIINNQTVFVNSVVDGHTIKEIGANYVVVQKGRAVRELQLKPIRHRSNTEIDIWDRLPAVESDPDDTGKKSNEK